MSESAQKRQSMGIQGLDGILHGGLLEGRSYLVRGGPGTGKTTLALHFLAATTEPCVFVSLHESPAMIQQSARQMGLSTGHVAFLDLSPTAEDLARLEEYTLFAPSEVEGGKTSRQIAEHIAKAKPKRLVVDSLTQLRYLSQSEFHFRQQLLALQRFLREQGTTVVFLSECMAEDRADLDLQHLVDGVLHMRSTNHARYLRVSKLRGSNFEKGEHAFRIAGRGIDVFPKLLPKKSTLKHDFETISSGIPSLDEMLQGGLERGTVTIVTGPTGVGKTTLGVQFMKEAAGRGESSLIYSFEEQPEILVQRCESINLPIRKMLEHQSLKLKAIEPLLLYPDEFALDAVREVEENGVSIIMIDSIAGYRLAMLSDELEQTLTERLHAICKHLQNLGVTVILVNEMEKVTGDFQVTNVGISYLADNIIFLRYLELDGELKRAIGVLKKRMSDFEKTLREFRLTQYGLRVDEPYTQMRGILTGRPVMVESSTP